MEREATAPWTLLLGPGARLAGLRTVLEAAATDRLGPQAPPVRALEDLLDLLADEHACGRILLDTDAIAPEDLGIVRRFLGAHPGWDVLLTGQEEGSRAARGLLGLTGPRWRSWPLDLDQLDHLLSPPDLLPEHTLDQGAAGTLPSAGPEAAPTPTSWEDPPPTQTTQPFDSQASSERPLGHANLRELEEDLEAIEQILAQDPGHPGPEPTDELGGSDPLGDLDPRGMDLTPEEIEAFFGDAIEEAGPPPSAGHGEDPGITPSSPAVPNDPPRAEALGGAATAIAALRETSSAGTQAGGWAPPAWYKDQVADLADRAQRLHLSLSVAQEDPQQQPALAQDVLSMTQFARTLGFLASPPGRGHQEFGLDTLLEELLAGVAGAREDGPRYLFRPDPGARVRSDKVLLCTALDAVFQVADACAGSEDVVRVSLEGDVQDLQLCIRFPAGPLAEVPCEAALAPYALHRLLPTIGPNAMAAAGRILQGQGGDLGIGETEDPQERVLLVRLPRA